VKRGEGGGLGLPTWPIFLTLAEALCARTSQVPVPPHLALHAQQPWRDRRKRSPESNYPFWRTREAWKSAVQCV